MSNAQSVPQPSSLFAPSLASTANFLAEQPGAAPRRVLADSRISPSRNARPRRTQAALAQGADAQARARARFEEGTRLADELQWAQAAQAFEESYQLFPRPNTLFNLGLAHRALGQYTRAITELERFLQEGTPSPEERTQVSDALDQMRGRLAHLTIVPSVEGARVSVDGTAADANTDLTLDPGNHVIEITAQGYTRYARTITLRQSESQRHDARLERGGGVSAGVVVGIVAGVVAAGVLTGILIWQLSGEERPYCGTLDQCIMPQ
ncbi:MAG: PEGA domain-containing protein [Myxococcales bacterium]|nr:PEGA domain-containing protein [Myxococcales bacterium]